MNEDFLQFIWNFRLYNKADLKTTEGEPVEVLSPGVRNRDAGPDFYGAKIKIGATLWAGTVEVHRKSSDWNLHGHQNDKAYNNVILHVVEIADAVVARESGEPLAALEISCPPEFRQRYEELSKSKLNIPCANYVGEVDRFKVKFWFGRLATERTERKTATVRQLADETKNDFEEIFHRLLFKYFGFDKNVLPFEMLSRNLPAKLLKKYTGSQLSLEALLFGQSGLLDTAPADDYSAKLQTEYRFLRAKHNLAPIEGSLWKFAKLRPANFPTVRLAQLSTLLGKFPDLWEYITKQDNDLDDVLKIFDVKASEYWDTHYVFGGQSLRQTKTLGKTAVYSLVINVIVPVLFAYSAYRGDEILQEKAFRFLELVPAESNRIIDEWIACRIKPQNALESQALLQLKSEYCDKRGCLKCSIGKEIIDSYQ